MRFPSTQNERKKVVKFAASLLSVRSTRYVCVCLCVACDSVTSQDIYAFNTGMKQLNLKHLFTKRSKYTNKRVRALSLCLSDVQNVVFTSTLRRKHYSVYFILVLYSVSMYVSKYLRIGP